MASGPGSEFFNGLVDNTDPFWGIVESLGIDPLSPNGRSPMGKITGRRSGDPANPASKARFAKPETTEAFLPTIREKGAIQPISRDTGILLSKCGL